MSVVKDQVFMMNIDYGDLDNIDFKEVNSTDNIQSLSNNYGYWIIGIVIIVIAFVFLFFLIKKSQKTK